jgi:outer membrane biosynthesis protein TonB
MRFGAEILRGVRLAALVFAAVLIILTVRRVVTLDDAPAHTSASTAKPATSPEPQHVAIKGGAASKVPPPPPTTGMAVVTAKPAPAPAPKPRDVVIVGLPQEEQTIAANVPPPKPEPSVEPTPAAPVTAAPVAEPEETTPEKTEGRATKALRSVKKFFHFGK